MQPVQRRSFVCEAVLVLVLGFAAVAGAQPTATDPIQCWWRTSTGAVKVGEPFSLVLTCAVIETAELTVVPEQSQLEPSVLQLPPFEVLGGTHAPDLRDGDRRFFQYEYQLRIISESVFD